jgi:hypothetical protein
MNREPSFAYSQDALYEILHDEECSPRVHGAVYEHRLACARYIRTELWKLLDDPGMTRGKLRRELARLCKQVEEHGPPG